MALQNGMISNALAKRLKRCKDAGSDEDSGNLWVEYGMGLG